MEAANKKARMRGNSTKAKGKVADNAIREKNVATFATKTGQWAIKKATDNNIPVTVADRGFVYKIYPDGHKKRLARLPGEVRVVKQIIKM
jgi:hypothetical protein